MVDEIYPADPRQLLQQLCTDRGEDFASLSRLIGRNSAYVQQFIRRGTPRRLPERERRLLARHFGIDEQLLGAEPPAVSASGFVVPERVAEQSSDGEEPGIAFAPAWLRQLAPVDPDALRRSTVSGDAMAPTLQPGDELLVDVADSTGRLRDGVYLLRIDGMVQVRRLTLHPVRLEVTVQSDNPAYADWPGLKPGELELVGRVVWTGRRLA